MSQLVISRELVRRLEQTIANCCESLMRPIAALPDNGQGYDFFREGQVRALLSTNPHARWAVGGYGLNRQPREIVERVIAFFERAKVTARVRIVPDGFTPEQADVLSALGLRHQGFHTVMCAALPLPPRRGSADGVEVRLVTEPHEYERFLDVQLAGWDMPAAPDSLLKRIRRVWRTADGHHSYLAYCNGEPAAMAMLYIDGEVGYLENACTLKSFRNRGLHHALIARRIQDAEAKGCRMICGGADFESISRVNQLDSGLQTAYTAALWEQHGLYVRDAVCKVASLGKMRHSSRNRPSA